MTIKVLLVSHGDAITVASVVSRQGLTGLAAIVFAVGLPAVVTLLGVFAASAVGEAVREEDGLRGPVATLGVALLLALLFSSVYILLSLVAYSAVMVATSVVLQRLRARRVAALKPLPFMLRKSTQPQKAPLSLLLPLAMFLALSGLIFNDSLWLPKERLYVAHEPLTGYVIAGDGDFTHLIIETNRQTMVLRTSDIEKRVLCGGDRDERSLPLRVLWPERAAYEACD